MAPYVTSKLNQFVANGSVRPIIGQPRSTVDFASALDQQRSLDRGDIKIVGVTDFVETGPHGLDILQISHDTEEAQIERLKETKRRRDARRHTAALERIRSDAAANANMMPALIDAAKADATVGEMMDVMAGPFGRYDGGPEW